MFSLSNSHDFSYLKEPYLEREEKITYQSKLVIDVTQYNFTFLPTLKTTADKQGKNSRKPSKL